MEANLVMLLADIQKLELCHSMPRMIIERELLSFHKQVSDLLRYMAKAALQTGQRLLYES